MSANPYTVRVYTCAACGRPKGEANHWVILFLVRSQDVHLAPGLPVLMTVPTWDTRLAELVNAVPCCGPGCATRLQDFFMTHGQLPQPGETPAGAAGLIAGVSP